MGFQDFVQTNNYYAGDYVWKEEDLYQFMINHPAGPWIWSDIRKVSKKELINLLGTSTADLAALTALVNGLPNDVAGLEAMDATLAALHSLVHGEASENAIAAYHNAVPRNKDITSYLTDGSLWDRIKGTNGKKLFEDLFIGDKITAGGQDYIIVDFDYYIRSGSASDIQDHHLVMMPANNMKIPAGTVLYGSDPEETLVYINTANATEAAGEAVTVTSQETETVKKWNATMLAPNTDTTAGGYKFSRMRQVIMKCADTIIVNAFGAAHAKPIEVNYPNPADNTVSGTTGTTAWFNEASWSNDCRKSICDLPNELQVYGTMIHANRGAEAMLDKWQFSLFRVDRSYVNIRSSWWLRSVAGAANACSVISSGYANNTGSSGAIGVRPRFLLF